MSLESKYLPGKGKKVGLLGVPLGYGAATQGSELGTTAMRLAKFRGKRLSGHVRELGYEFTDRGDVEIVNPNLDDRKPGKPKYLPEIIQSCENMIAAVRSVLEKGEILIILGGDHSIAAGTFSGVSSHFRDNDEEVGLIWFDAHADMNTPESSPSGNTHGMPLSTILGHGDPKMVNLAGFAPKIKPEFCAHIGGRDLDLGEKTLVHQLGMRNNFFTMSDIDKRGMVDCVEDALAIASGASAGFAVTFDVDVIDPRFAPGSGTLVRGGLTYREAHLGLEMIAERGGMRSFEIVEVNPMLDESNVTAKLAGELILSALGNTIL